MATLEEAIGLYKSSYCRCYPSSTCESEVDALFPMGVCTYETVGDYLTFAPDYISCVTEGFLLGYSACLTCPASGTSLEGLCTDVPIELAL